MVRPIAVSTRSARCLSLQLQVCHVVGRLSMKSLANIQEELEAHSGVQAPVSACTCSKNGLICSYFFVTHDGTNDNTLVLLDSSQC